jgi:hypothetical protein
MPEAFTTLHRDRIIKAAARSRLPAIYPWDYFATAGGLVSYPSNFPDLARRAGSYVDRILKGARAGDLPVQQPTKVRADRQLEDCQGACDRGPGECVTAGRRAHRMTSPCPSLDITMPAEVLSRADEVIESGPPPVPPLEAGGPAGADQPWGSTLHHDAAHPRAC